jgi:hypothetical protein
MRWVYLALLAALPPLAVHGQEPASITLWCQSTSMVADDAKFDPIQSDPIRSHPIMTDPIAGGPMTVDLQERTVTFNSFRVPIARADDTMVLFHGEQATRYEGLRLTVDGSIDLVAGGVSVTFKQAGNNMTWKLTCPPFGLF